jgi:serine/threonine-protein kinase RsbW
MAFMPSPDTQSLRLEFTGALELIDLVEVAADHLGKDIGLDDDARHWVRIAIRESVVNAIKHGNQHDPSRLVSARLSTVPDLPPALSICIQDQGEGFDPATLQDPLAPENLLKGSGRGIFLIRSIMDDVTIRQVRGGGMEICMVKRAHPPGAPSERSVD